MQLSSTERDRLFDNIHKILITKGLKGTTMDVVASTLGMSKRTLYAIFTDKREMILETLKHVGQKDHAHYMAILEESPDVISALYKLLDYNVKSMQEVSPSLFRDLDYLFKDLREDIDAQKAVKNEHIQKLIQRGIQEGMFRDNLNYEVLLKMQSVQLESLKRMEELFPEGITLADAYRTIMISFLRSIATIKGIEILDAREEGITEITHNQKQ